MLPTLLLLLLRRLLMLSILLLLLLRLCLLFVRLLLCLPFVLLRLRLRLRLRLLLVLLLLSGMLEAVSLLLSTRRLLVTSFGRIERILKVRGPLMRSRERRLSERRRSLEMRRRVELCGRRFSSEMWLVEASGQNRLVPAFDKDRYVSDVALLLRGWFLLLRLLRLLGLWLRLGLLLLLRRLIVLGRYIYS